MLVSVERASACRKRAVASRLLLQAHADWDTADAHDAGKLGGERRARVRERELAREARWREMTLGARGTGAAFAVSELRRTFSPRSLFRETPLRAPGRPARMLRLRLEPREPLRNSATRAWPVAPSVASLATSGRMLGFAELFRLHCPCAPSSSMLAFPASEEYLLGLP